MITSIIFDFDGVILESVSVKTDAFRTLFSFVPEHVDEIVQFHKDNGGMSRYDKFCYIYNTILKQELTQKKFKELSDAFSVIVFDKVIKTPFVPGAQEFLKGNYRRFTLYVVSATPEDELRQIIEKRGLAGYFHGIYGAPVKKTEHIRRILSETKSRKEDTLFIGDALNDLLAAESSGIRFIGRVLPGERNYFIGNPAVEHTITTLFDLNELIRRETST